MFKIIYNISVITLIFNASVVSFCENLVNLTIAKERVEYYYECGHYDKDMNKIISRALKHFENITPCDGAAVVFDVDDTVLSNYCDEKDIRFGYVPKLSHEWVLRADAPAIEQTKNLYDYLVCRGFRIIFITGRKHNEYESTIKNLKDQGFNTFDKLIVRSEQDADLSARDYKSARRAQLVRQGYRILGNVGDQWSDLYGGNSGYQVKLPNYKYIID